MQLAIELLVSRIYPLIDSRALTERRAHDRSFLLHPSANNRTTDDDRAVGIDWRSALVWIDAARKNSGWNGND
jgi:hypothetical protein